MNIPLYSMIFISKVIENALATLRLIVVSNGKKWLGAILQFLIAIVWVFVTGIVVTDIKKDPLKIVFFAIGSFAGSYIGSMIEERLALGNNMISAIVNSNHVKQIVEALKKEQYGVTVLEGYQDNQKLLMSLVPRKKRKEVTKIILKFEPNAFMSAEKAAFISNLSK